MTKKYKAIIKSNSYTALKSLCLNISTQKKYCDSKLKKNYWTKMFKIISRNKVMQLQMIIY